eukprot:scaffold422991_cov62-Attheya_sp.AAC.1
MRHRLGKTVSWSELSVGLNTQITRDKVTHHGVLVRCCPCAIPPPQYQTLFTWQQHAREEGYCITGSV